MFVQRTSTSWAVSASRPGCQLMTKRRGGSQATTRPHGERATITVGPDDILTTAHNRLRNAGFSQLPVMEEDRLVGVVTEDDIIRVVFGKPELMTSPVREAMRTSFLIVDKDTSINNLVALLHGDSYAAVTADDGAEFLGLITRSDVLNYLRRLHQGN